MSAETWRTQMPDWAGSATALHAQAEAIAACYALPPPAQWRVGYRDLGHWRIACWGFWPAEPAIGTLWIWHGLFDHVGLCRHLIRIALACRYVVLAIDLPGHGLSSGAAACIDDFSAYQDLLHAAIADVDDVAPRPWKALGQSTGGGILIEHLLRSPVPAFREVLLLAPLVRPAAFWQARILHALLRRWVSSWPRNFRANSSDAAFLHFIRHDDPLQAQALSVAWVGAMLAWERRLRHLPSSPAHIHVLQGECDATVDWRYNLPWLQRHFPHADIQRLPQASHQLANERADLRQPVEQALRLFLGGTAVPTHLSRDENSV